MKKRTNKLYLVVYVYSGIHVSAELYRNRRAAEKREKALRQEMHPENDETAIFEVTPQ